MWATAGTQGSGEQAASPVKSGIRLGDIAPKHYKSAVRRLTLDEVVDDGGDP